MSAKPFVYLVGAGPGDPGLLTLRGLECLREAEFVLYDQLVSPGVLALIPETTEKLSVRDLPGCHPERWPHIHEKIIAEARLGKTVVRLKGGDPLIFGRGGEEAEALRDAGIPYEIVPGVTAALAAGAYLEIPLTHRAHASGIAFVTGHEHPHKPTSRLDWQALAAFPGTLVIYMGISRLSAITTELIRFGKAPDTPAAVVSKASTGEQQSVITTLEHLEIATRNAGLVTPALVILGLVVERKPAISWFEARPLLGQRILVTRPRQQALPMIHRLEQLGAVTHLLPAVEIHEPLDWQPVDSAIDRLRNRQFHWLIFTSANGVEAFFNRLKTLGNDLRILGGVQLAVIGSKTAEALAKFHLQADVVSTEAMHSEAFAALLRDQVAGKRVLIAQVESGRDLLREQLAQVAEVETIAVYRQVESIVPATEIFDHLRRGEIDLITLTSNSIANSFWKNCDETIRQRLRGGDIRVISNNRRTTELLKAEGVNMVYQSADPTSEAMIETLLTVAALDSAQVK